MEIEYHPAKAKANRKKHGVSFEEAATCLQDPMALALEDRRSKDEARWVLVGMSEQGRLLTVVYTLRRREQCIRLISARVATRYEANNYAQTI